MPCRHTLAQIILSDESERWWTRTPALNVAGQDFGIKHWPGSRPSLGIRGYQEDPAERRDTSARRTQHEPHYGTWHVKSVLTDSPFWPLLPGLPRSAFSPCECIRRGHPCILRLLWIAHFLYSEETYRKSRRSHGPWVAGRPRSALRWRSDTQSHREAIPFFSPARRELWRSAERLTCSPLIPGGPAGPTSPFWPWGWWEWGIIRKQRRHCDVWAPPVTSSVDIRETAGRPAATLRVCVLCSALYPLLYSLY